MSTPSNSPRRRILLLGGVGAAAIALVGGGRFIVEHERVLFLNGLDVPVQVAADGAHFELPPGGSDERMLRAGLHEVDVRAGEARLAHDTLYVSPSGGLHVYNVLGAAPLYRQTITYSSSPQSDDESAPPVLPLAGKPFLLLGHVDFVLTDPPERIEMKSSDHGTTSRTRLAVLSGGWRMSIPWLIGTHHPAEAARLTQALMHALPGTPELEALAATSTMANEHLEGSFATVAAARAWRDAQPDSDEAHRLWIRQMRRTGRNEEARAYYAAALAREPGSPRLATMLARTEPGPEATARLEALWKEHPDDPRVRWGLVIRYEREQRWKEALALLEAMEKGDPRYPVFRETHARALVALGRREEATRRVAEQLLADGAERPGWDDVLLYARLFGRSTSEAEAPLQKLIDSATQGEGEVLRTWLAASLGESVARRAPAGSEQTVLPMAMRVLTSIIQGPEAAARVCANVERAVFGHVGTEAGVLLAGEFERLGDAALAARTLAASDVALSYGELRDVVRGTRTADSLEALDLPERAALSLVVARRLEASGANADKAYALVKQEAQLPGPVSAALEHWPRPGASQKRAGATEP